jgi:hypothetical protein
MKVARPVRRAPEKPTSRKARRALRSDPYTIDLYAALNLATGVVTHQLTARHRAVEFQKFLNLIDRTMSRNTGRIQGILFRLLAAFEIRELEVRFSPAISAS